MYRDKGGKDDVSKQGLQFNNDRKRTEDENEACFWSYNFNMCAFHYHSNPIEKFSIAY